MAYFDRWRHLFAKEWREEDHPRGKTVEGTNSGSFAPRESAGQAGEAGEAGWGVSPSRRGGTLADIAREAQVSSSPATTLSSYYDDRRELGVVLAEMAALHGEQSLSEYQRLMAANTALVEAKQETLLVHWNVEFDENRKVVRDEGIKPERAAVFAPHYAKAEAEMAGYESHTDPDDPPELVILGGLGGSGKSQFADVDDEGRSDNQLGLYSKSTHYVIDPDATKEWIPEYNRTNATVVHEESSRLTQSLIDRARARRINTVIDITMSSPGSVMKKLEPFIKAGYRIKMGYMHLPRTEAAARAYSRWWKKGDATGRMVPIDIPLRAQGNEEAFDSVRHHADEWVLYSNDVQRGTPPRLIASGKKVGKAAAAKFQKYEEEPDDEIVG